VLVKARSAIFLVLCSVLLLCQPVGRSQVDTATITGRVVDPSGAAIQDTKITVLNSDTQVIHKTATNNDGLFNVPGLLPGNYRIEAAKSGFKTVIKPDVILHVQDVVAVNLNMILGSMTESVTVEGGAPVVNTESGAVSTVIDRQFVENLPMNGRSFNTLLQLTPGVVIAAQTSSQGDLGQFSINGQRTDGNYFTVDGVGANFGTSPSGNGQGAGVVPALNAAGGTSSLVSVDAMQEFRIQTSSFAPEYGHQPGGQIAIETRSGTNDFHGDAFDYFRNTVLDANNWFNDASGKPRSPDQQNDFGGVLGGPILIPGLYNGHDKTFFFFSYEGLRLRQPQTRVVTVPTLALRASAIPAAAPYLNAFPKPDAGAPDLGNGTADFTGGWSNQITSNATSIRVDHSFGSRWNIFGRFNDAPSQTANRTDSLNEIDSTEVNTRTLTIGLAGILKPQLTNSLRVNYSGQLASSNATVDSFGGAVPLASSLLLPQPLTRTNASGQFFPLFDTNGGYIDGFLGQTKSTQFNILDDLSFNWGTHQLKFGADERALWVSRPGQSGLLYLPSSTKNFASTATDDIFTISVGIQPAKVLAHSISLFSQDTWKIGRRLTMTYGLRWELDPAPSPLGNTAVASWENVKNPATTTLAPAGTSPWRTTYGNFAPRLGLAYRLTPSGSLVVRGGGGFYYDTGLGVVGNLLASFPNQATLYITTPLALPRPNLGGLEPSFSTQPPYQSSLFAAMSPDLRLPLSYQWNVSVERSFNGQQSFSVTYLGQVGRRLLRTEESLLPSSNPNFLPSSFFALTSNADTSDYDALQLQYRRPLAKTLQILANYTWGHSIDTNSTDVLFNGSSQIVAPGANRGSSSFDVRHNFTGALTYDIATGLGPKPIRTITNSWSLSLIAQARTGFPIDVFTSQLSPLSFQGVSRPDLVPGQPIWITDSNVPGGKRLNRAAFAVPTTARQGDLPRNWIQGFGMTQFDFSIARRFDLTEHWKLQLRSDMFNLLNHPNFSNPDNALSCACFGVANSMLNQGLGGLNALYQVGGPRSLQLSLKLLF
jgi:hypothetical protein